MIFEADDFVFEPPIEVKFARRVLVKPGANYPLPYPVSSSRETLEEVVAGIRRVSDADIVFLEGSWGAESAKLIFKRLGYEFPRVTLVDVDDCVLVEVENPLAHPFAMPTFWIPNVVLSCDFLITLTPFKVIGGKGSLSIMSLLSLLPTAKYGGELAAVCDLWRRFGIHNVVADLYFTLPFDLGIVDGRQQFISSGDPTQGEAVGWGQIFVGRPYEVDFEASEAADVETDYLRLIRSAKMAW